MLSEHHLSERRACRLVGLSRDSYRQLPTADQATLDLHEKSMEIAHVRRRFGYRRIHDLLRPQFPGVNLVAWAQAHGIRHILIQPGRPMQNGYIDSFNGKFRDEHLNECWFQTLHQARVAVCTTRSGRKQLGTHATGSLRQASPAR